MLAGSQDKQELHTLLSDVLSRVSRLLDALEDGEREFAFGIGEGLQHDLAVWLVRDEAGK